MNRSFYFIRHGQTDWNAEGRLQGSKDTPLNERGRQQAAAAIALLADLPIDVIISSDLSRTMETTTIINQSINKPVYADSRLRERHFGIIGGMTQAEMAARPWQELFVSIEEDIDGHRLPIDGEPMADFEHRIIDTTSSLLKENPNSNILFVGHGGPFRVLQRRLIGTNNRPANAVPHYFEYDGSWRLHEIGNQSTSTRAAGLAD
jgi:broad specificity phosphatase PhoE